MLTDVGNCDGVRDMGMHLINATRERRNTGNRSRFVGEAVPRPAARDGALKYKEVTRGVCETPVSS